MEITLSRLLEGKATIIKGKEFLATKDYVKPFIDEMSKYTDKFIVNVLEPTQTIISDSEDFTFNRVWIQAIMPDSCNVEGLNEIYHFVYGLDVRTPVYKVFRSYGPCVFNSNWLTVNKLEGEKLPEYSIKTLMEYTNDVGIQVKKMKNTFLDSDKRHDLLGKLMEKSTFYVYQHDGGKVKLSPAMMFKAYENVYLDSSSDYYVKETEECSVWNYFEALTSLVRDDVKKDIVTYAEKCHLCYNLLSNLI